MSNKFLIALDMDGTLLTNEKVISVNTKKYLIDLSAKGHIVVLASGRPSRALYEYYNELQLTSPMACYNGAYVFSPYDKEFPIQQFEFPKNVVLSIFHDLKKYIKNVLCETDDEMWMLHHDEFLTKFFWIKGMNVYYGSFEETLNKNPMTMIVQVDKELSEDDKKIISSIVGSYKDVEARFWTGQPYFEVFYKQISKGSALKHICDTYKIKQENVIAFGDAENDLEMWDFAAYPILMINGKEELKKLDLILSDKTNDEDGIIHALDKIFKGEYKSKF